MKSLGLKLETKLFKGGYSIVVGCDEVGRGALAGPIVAGAVAMSEQWTVNSGQNRDKKDYAWTVRVRDSKLLTQRQREKLEVHIKQTALAWGVGVVSAGVIDKINIHQANLLAMERAVNNLIAKVKTIAQNNHHLSPFLSSRASFRVEGSLHSEKLPFPPSPLRWLWRTDGMTDLGPYDESNIYLLIDGKYILPNWEGGQEAVVNGDAKIFSIAAASIIAKVYRDQLMVKLDKKFPAYSFAKHKGYGTAEHCQKIKQHGLSKLHRRSFCRRFL